MDRIYSMQVFIKVAEANSFTKAADILRMPKASVSTYVQQLETLIGTRLFHRTTRSVQLTQDGMTFYERCKDLLIDVEEAESMFQESASGLKGRIRVDLPVVIAKTVVIPKLPEFLKLHPLIEMEMSSTDRRVDLVQEGFDCVVRVGTLNDSGLMVRSVGEMGIINCVSPSYIEKFGKPKNLDDLVNHYLVHYALTLGAKPFGFEYFDNGKYKTLQMKGAMTVNSTEAYVAACLGGFGIIQSPAVGMLPYLKSGELVEVLPKVKSEPMPVSIIYPNRRNLPRRVKVFMDWLDVILKDYIK